MTAVVEALAWSGSGADVSLFVAGPSGRSYDAVVVTPAARPDRVSTFALEDDAGSLDLLIVEIDAHFVELPTDLKSYLVTVLGQAVDAGAHVAWLAFEGSFHFEHLLTDDVAAQVYGLALPGSKPLVALSGAELKSPQWLTIVQQARARLLQTA